MPVESWVTMGVAILTLFGAVGSVSVLFYRVRELERTTQHLDDHVSRADASAGETKETVIAIKQDVEWIKKRMEQWDG